MTNNKQQTAVEWLVEQFENHRATFFKLNDKEERVITLAGRDVVEQAKEMDKEQKKECWDVAHQAGRFKGKGIAQKNWQTFEQYSNETYGNNHIGDVNKMVGGKQ
jgi:hypothetical protein